MSRCFAYKGQVGRKYDKGCTKPKSGRCSSINGLRASVFEDKDDPDYKPKYGTTYTERQQQIADGKIPLTGIPMRELGLLANKARALGDQDTYDYVHGFMEMMKGNRYRPTVSVEEAKKGLQELTPWEIDWDTLN